MNREDAAPCRHFGVPNSDMVDEVVKLIGGLSINDDFMASHGISKDDFDKALPMAVQKMKGSMAASTAASTAFVVSIFSHLQACGFIHSFETPDYGDSAVYRIRLNDGTSIAVIKKGCPDSVHCSIAWTVPEWASETYLWWVCSAVGMEPGEHVAKGVARLRSKFFDPKMDSTSMLDGIIFHSPECGSSMRPCPKTRNAVMIGDRLVPPPCVWTMPDKPGQEGFYNWDGSINRRFPEVLLSGFGVLANDSAVFTGHVGFQNGTRNKRTTITSRYGAAQSTTFKEG